MDLGAFCFVYMYTPEKTQHVVYTINKYTLKIPLNHLTSMSDSFNCLVYTANWKEERGTILYDA